MTAGIIIPGTSAEQGRFCVNNNLTVAKDDLVPGDLVFWSHKPNGRFMNITHVGVYAGNRRYIFEKTVCIPRFIRFKQTGSVWKTAYFKINVQIFAVCLHMNAKKWLAL